MVDSVLFECVCIIMVLWGLYENHYQSVKKCKGSLQGSGFALLWRLLSNLLKGSYDENRRYV